MQTKENNPYGSILLNEANYITDQDGNIKSIILDYQTFKKIEEILFDYGLGKAMEEVEDEDELDLNTAKTLSGYKE